MALARGAGVLAPSNATRYQVGYPIRFSGTALQGKGRAGRGRFSQLFTILRGLGNVVPARRPPWRRVHGGDRGILPAARRLGPWHQSRGAFGKGVSAELRAN